MSSTPVASKTNPITPSPLFIGLMSGTSLDGVDGVLAQFPADFAGGPLQAVAEAYIPFPADLRSELMALQSVSTNELEREALVANRLAQLYAQCVASLLQQSDLTADAICAIGVHGQTLRHRPEYGFTWQSNNPALLAELSGIDVIADFRSRDIAAGGQGAPLVPAFHQTVFGAIGQTRVVVNIGGISNISVLHQDRDVIGFDTGPGNVLVDAWIMQQQGKSYDADGAWAASGNCVPALLDALLDEDFFALPAPKSTGRDLFHPAWLAAKLAPFLSLSAADIQATLVEFTVVTLANAIAAYAPQADSVYVCGGGVLNGKLMRQLAQALLMRGCNATLQSTAVLGVPPHQVEALAFAWLAQRFTQRLPGNMPVVTGARGLRILGALYPA
ncbi:MAG: anhydro-N-acetylmuramic acid kinase [Pseudomonadota bacterium]